MEGEMVDEDRVKEEEECVWGEVLSNEVESCRWPQGRTLCLSSLSTASPMIPLDFTTAGPPPQPRTSPHPSMHCDLLSCKHIGSSIENGLTKSIKADIVPGIGGAWWRREGGACVRVQVGPFRLPHPSLHLHLQAFLSALIPVSLPPPTPSRRLGLLSHALVHICSPSISSLSLSLSLSRSIFFLPCVGQ